MEDMIIVGLVVLIVGAIIFYLVRKKKKGVKCIGCPYCEQCAEKHGKCASPKDKRKKE